MEEVATGVPPVETDVFEPKPITFGPEREEELSSIISKNYSDTITSAWFQKRMKDIDEFHKIYLGVMDNSSWPWSGASNCDLGIVEMCTDNIKSRYKLSTIGAKPMFNTIPVSPSGEDKKEKVTDSMNYVLENDIEIEKVLDEVAQKTVEFGTCPVKLYWKRDILETKKYETDGELVYPIDKSDTIEKGCLEVIELNDLITPENCPNDLNKSPWVFQRIWYSVYDLEKKVKLGFYSKDKVEEIKMSLTMKKQSAFKSPEEKAKAIENLSEEKVEILECYMRFDADNDNLEEECVFWYCPTTRTYLKGYYLKDIYFNGKRPFYVFRYKDTGSFYGRGIPEITRPYRTLLNDLFNFSVNCLMLQILPWGFYRIGSSFKPEEVRLAPGVMIPVDDINDVKIASFPATAQVVEGVVQLIMSFIERQTGISSPSMGKEFPTRKTATEVRTIISEGNVKHEDRIQVFQDVFSDLLKGVYELYKQNQNIGRIGRIGDGEDYRFVELFSAFDQLPDFDFIVLGTLTTGNKSVEREDAMALYSITQQNAMMAEWPIGQLEMLKELFTTFGKRNIKRFLPPDELVQMYTQAKMGMLMQQMAMMQAGVNPQQAGQPGQTPAEEQAPEPGPEPQGGEQ